MPPTRSTAPDGSSSALPQVGLVDLLAELQTRLVTVLTSRDRERSLLEAVLAVASDLDLQAVLRRITEVAATLVDAEYGALGASARTVKDLPSSSSWASTTS